MSGGRLWQSGPRAPVVPVEELENPELVGAGGFGAVFRARHRTWRTGVAVKILEG